MGRTSDARDRLMEAASKLIWEYSYGSVTIDAICEQAGVKKGSFYYFFESKPDLAVAAIDVWWIKRKALMEELFQTDIPPLARIQKYFDFVSQKQLAAFRATGQVLGCPLFSLGSEISTQDERIRLRIHGIIVAMTRYFEEAIAEAKLTGEVESRDPVLTTRILLTYYAGVLIRARTENNPDILETLTSDCFEVIGVSMATAGASSEF